MSQSLPDPDLVGLLERARSGCRESLGNLLEAHRRYLLKIANSELDSETRPKCSASDIVQISLSDAAKAIDRFEGASLEEFRRWLSIIVRHDVDDARKQYQPKARRERVLEPGDIDGTFPIPSDDSSPSERVVRDECDDELARLLQTLPNEERVLLQARIVENKRWEEIGAALGCSPDAAARRYQRLLLRLRGRMERVQ